MKNVLILGCTGMLGGMCVKVLSQNPLIKLYGASRAYPKNIGLKNWDEFDVNNFHKRQLRKIIKEHEIDYVINAIGIIKPNIDETNIQSRKNAIHVNSTFPGKLSNLADELNFKILQIATDCVYSGNSIDRYDENSPHTALDVYGKTKSLGEVPGDNITHIRCSIIGPEFYHKKSLLEWVITQEKNSTINGYANHTWNGVGTLQFAKICEGIILNDLSLPKLVHVVPSDIVTKYDLLKHITKYYNREDLTVEPTMAPQTINRCLDTINPEINNTLWDLAGYKTPPTIEQIVEELSQV